MTSTEFGELFSVFGGFDLYQERTSETSIYPKELRPFLLTMGLCGEAGEVAEAIKKHYRDGLDEAFTREKVEKELGDVLWYVAQMADYWGLSLGWVAATNLQKLESRKARGTISGSGDDR